MKIECDKCAAKYSIADEKVRGKTFKIRCKKCSNVIIVRDKGAAAEGGDDAGADQGAPGWHLAINGETVGPLAEDDVRARYSDGEIDKDTAVWQEGFEDWIPLGDVPVFADLPDAALGGGGGYDDSYGQEDDDPFVKKAKRNTHSTKPDQFPTVSASKRCNEDGETRASAKTSK